MKITLQHRLDDTTKIGVECIVPKDINRKELSTVVHSMKSRLEKKVDAFLAQQPVDQN